MHRQHRVLLRPGVAEQDVLLVVVAQHLVRDVVGHRGQQGVALLERQVAVRASRRSSRILMLTSWSEVSTPARVVDGVGVDPDPAQRGLDPAELGQAEVAALADDLAAQRVAVDPDRVVGPVADLGVGLGRRLDVGADAAVPEQVDRRRAGSPSSARPGVIVVVPLGSPSAVAICGADRHRLGRARVERRRPRRSARVS